MWWYLGVKKLWKGAGILHEHGRVGQTEPPWFSGALGLAARGAVSPGVVPGLAPGGLRGQFLAPSPIQSRSLRRPEIQKSRADRIRTCDLFVPNEARYQPALQLDVVMTGRFYNKNQDLQA